MYTCRYNYWDEKRFPGFKRYLQKLYSDSYDYYMKNINLYDYSKYCDDTLMINKFMSDLEYYYVTLIRLGIVTKSNYENVLNQLKKLKLIKMFPNDQRKLYGLTYKNEISINPEIKGREILNKECMEQLCISHELGHMINFSWDSDAVELSKELYQDNQVKKTLRKIGLDSHKYIRNGFYLLDEVVVQEVAERVAYNLACKPRPSKEYRTDKAIFNHNPYLTNYVLYGELQTFATEFARCLSFLNCKDTDNDDEVLKKLAKASFNRDFIKKLRIEIINSSKRDELIKMLACMGRIKEATYTVLGLNKKENLDVNHYVYIFNNSNPKK